MAITAKELAELLGLSPSAVSLALNSKPGVSTQTRMQVLQAAHEYGYDFSRIAEKNLRNRVVEFVRCIKYGTVVTNADSFHSILAGVQSACKELGFKVQFSTCYEESNYIRRHIEDLRMRRPAGVILLATEMSQTSLMQFRELMLPLVLLDGCVEDAFCDSVMFDNAHAAFTATRYLIQKCQTQPGYLQSSLPIQNYQERSDGFFQGVWQAGLSHSNSVVHRLSPTMEGALADMLNIIEAGIPLAKCYFADSDLIAAGAIKALQLKGYRIPEDISVIGFDDTPLAEHVNLTTMRVSTHHLGMMAVAVLSERIRMPDVPFVKARTSATLIVRNSVVHKQ